MCMLFDAALGFQGATTIHSLDTACHWKLELGTASYALLGRCDREAKTHVKALTADLDDFCESFMHGISGY